MRLALLTIVFVSIMGNSSVGQTQGRDVLHYKFEGMTGRGVVNFARQDPTIPLAEVPALGVIDTSPTTLGDSGIWTTGTFGQGALKGGDPNPNGAEVNSGWNHEILGDLTVAFFIKNRVPLDPTDQASIFHCPNNLLGIAGVIRSDTGQFQLYWDAGGGSNAPILPADILSMS